MPRLGAPSPPCCSEGDFLFVGPDVFDQLEEAKREVNLPEYLANSKFHKVCFGCSIHMIGF